MNCRQLMQAKNYKLEVIRKKQRHLIFIKSINSIKKKKTTGTK